MVKRLEELAFNLKSNIELADEITKRLGTIKEKMPYLNSAVLGRSVEYDCDCGDGCDGPDCDTSGYKKD